MHKDKSATTAKIIACMREEFLTWGYEKASVNRIAKKVGITSAGLYKHFEGKEAMFGFLVKDTLEALEQLQAESSGKMSGDAAAYSPFREEYMIPLVDFIYEHYEGFKLLLCCSEGSRYGSFEEDLIESETETNKQYARMLAQSGVPVKALSDMEWHLLSTEYIHAVFEIIRHNLSKEDAYRHMEFIRTLMYPGWQKLFGLA
ncbi:MAG TPA: TetR/AcrR family transcriptional regulator [Treponema sp.]|nr:TetR/AcrR family transcriptional regulator [Treponema sp.]